MKVVYSISRLRPGRKYSGEVLVLHEYLSKTGDLVGLATCHFEYHYFISGLPLATVVGENIYYSSKVIDEFKSLKREQIIQLNSDCATTIQREVEPLRALLSRPPKDQREVSILKEYQLHVELRPEVSFDFTDIPEGMKIEIPSDQVLGVKIIHSSDEEYVSPNPDKRSVSGGVFMAELYKPVKKAEMGRTITIGELRSILQQKKDDLLKSMQGRTKAEKRAACKPINDILNPIQNQDKSTVITVDLSTIEDTY